MNFQSPLSEYKSYKSLQQHNYTVENQCKDLYVLLLIESNVNYEKQFYNCKSILGRLPTKMEGKIFKDTIFGIYQKAKPLSLWVEGGRLGADDLIMQCPVISGKKQLISGSIPCILDIQESICIAMMYTHYYLYGKINKFGRNYILLRNNSRMYLNGDSKSIIYQSENNWIISSGMHEETGILINQNLPFGRKYWNFKHERFLLTVTHCKSNQFACSDGTCISSKFRCSGKVECADSSDEEHCAIIQHGHGYMKNLHPPPINDEKHFYMKYKTNIYNIADISTSDGVAVVDIRIIIWWHDSRLTFWNLHGSQSINCEDIWSPFMSMADDETSGFQLKFETYRHSCMIKSVNTSSKLIKADPYMGK